MYCSNSIRRKYITPSQVSRMAPQQLMVDVDGSKKMNQLPPSVSDDPSLENEQRVTNSFYVLERTAQVKYPGQYNFKELLHIDGVGRGRENKRSLHGFGKFPCLFIDVLLVLLRHGSKDVIFCADEK
mmetsp:Transcript_8214/g.10372  ORF Transcript_8214/g.10372 Transcript_8214/m.10372 type:complete len:127 (-) Transcript_8214:403-783(-)